MAVSEAQKKSAQKWDAANLDRVSLAMAKGKREEIKAAAAAAGESMNQYIIRSVDMRMNLSVPQEPAEAHGGGGAILSRETLVAAQEADQEAGETVPAFIGRAVETQAKRDNSARRLLRPKEKAPDHSGA